MKNNTEAIRMLINNLSTSDAGALHKWLGKLLPKKTETEAHTKTRTLTDAAKWWMAKLKSGNVLPGIGWPTMLSVDDLVEDYINAIKRNISRRGNATAMGRFLSTVDAVEEDKSSVKTEVTIRAGEPGGESLKPGATITRTKRARHYILHGLDDCRAGFEEVYGKQEWPGAQAEGDSDADSGD